MEYFIGVGTSSDSVGLVLAGVDGGNFSIEDYSKIDFEWENSKSIGDLVNALTAKLKEYKAKGAEKAAVVKRSAGQRGASVEAIKAEGLAEVICSQDMKIAWAMVSPKSFPKSLNVPSGKKWQQHARAVLDPDQGIKNWDKIRDAATAAHKIAFE